MSSTRDYLNQLGEGSCVAKVPRSKRACLAPGILFELTWGWGLAKQKVPHSKGARSPWRGCRTAKGHI
eukprot:6928473-Pyramimonas_sp.AAC.1